MSHEVEQMFYVNEVPWHGLGKQLDAPPTMEDAIIDAGLDWTVKMEKLYLVNGAQVPKKRAAVRSSDSSVLGIVGKNWTPLQNSEAFEFFQPFLDAGEACLETAGSLRHGKRVWVLARIKCDPSEIVKGDEVIPYLMLSNAHCGGIAVSVALTPIRVVCANTLAVAEEMNTSKILRVIHSQSVKESLDLVQETVSLVRRRFEATAEQYKILASRAVSIGGLEEYVTRIFWPQTIGMLAVPDKERKAIARLTKSIEPLYHAGKGMDSITGVRGTWWAVYNSVAEYLSYNRGNSRDVRMESLWFGGARSVNDRALQIATEMAVS